MVKGIEEDNEGDAELDFIKWNDGLKLEIADNFVGTLLRFSEGESEYLCEGLLDNIFEVDGWEDPVAVVAGCDGCSESLLDALFEVDGSRARGDRAVGLNDGYADGYLKVEGRVDGGSIGDIACWDGL